MVKEIPLSKGYVALVDDEDYDRVSELKWYAQVLNNGVYAVHRASRTYLHRFVVGCSSNLEVDHINHNCLDNRKDNLRVVTRSLNNANQRKTKSPRTSKYKGVCKFVDKRNGWTAWIAQIQVRGVRKEFSYHKTEVEAALKYNEYAIKYFGEFAHINDIQEAS